MKPLIFISCGQVTEAEIKLGKTLHDIIVADGRYEPYFAENQSSLEGVTANILARLMSAEAFVAVLHPRGDVTVPLTQGERTLTRASLWIEQEIAILAALSQVQRRSIRMQLYSKRGVAREGLRVFVMANPYEFDTDDQVPAHFLGVLAQWNLQLGPRALAAAEEEILGRCADTGHIELVQSADTGSFVRVPGCSFKSPTDRAVAARFIEAVKVLLEHGLIRQTDSSAYELTAAGFERARTIERDPSWLVIQPVVRLCWPHTMIEPLRLQVFLRNAGSLMPSSVIVTISFPRKYLNRDVPDVTPGEHEYEELRFALDRSEVLVLQPGAFNARILAEAAFLINRPARKVMPEEVGITVTADDVAVYDARFSLEQLFEREDGRCWAVSRRVGAELSHFIYV